MNTILQDILGLFTRKKIITSKQLRDNDYLAVAEIKSKSVGTPSERDVRLIKASDLSPAPEEKLIDEFTVLPAPGVNGKFAIDLSQSDYFIIDIGAIDGIMPGSQEDYDVVLLPQSVETFVGTKQIVIKYAPWGGVQSFDWENVKWPNNVDPIWSNGNAGKPTFDVVTITGHARGSGQPPLNELSYLGVASVNHIIS